MSVSPYDDPAVSEAELELYGGALCGVIDERSLAPLLRYIRSGFAVRPEVLEQLALDIEFGLIVVAPPKVRTGPSPESVGKATEEKMRVGAYVHVRECRSPRGWSKRIRAEAATHFQISERQVKSSVELFRREWFGFNRPFVAWYLGQALRQLCNERGLSYEQELSNHILDRD